MLPRVPTPQASLCAKQASVLILRVYQGFVGVGALDPAAARGGAEEPRRLAPLGRRVAASAGRGPFQSPCRRTVAGGLGHGDARRLPKACGNRGLVHGLGAGSSAVTNATERAGAAATSGGCSVSACWGDDSHRVKVRPRKTIRNLRRDNRQHHSIKKTTREICLEADKKMLIDN